MPTFEEFLRLVMTHTDTEQLHIITYSMGSLVVTLASNRLRKDSSIAGELEKIHQLILGAPDIDQGEFRSTILPEFKDIGKRRTIYASGHDGALKYFS